MTQDTPLTEVERLREETRWQKEYILSLFNSISKPQRILSTPSVSIEFVLWFIVGLMVGILVGLTTKQSGIL